MIINPQEQNESPIVKVEGSPKSLENINEPSRWKSFVLMIAHWISAKKDLGEAYLDAQVAKEKNTASKIAEEAAEISVRKDRERQKEAEDFFKLVDEIFKDDDLPPIAKRLKLAKLLENNPSLEEQLNKIEEILEKLEIIKGVKIRIEKSEIIKEIS